MHYNPGTLIMCLHPLGLYPLPYNVIDLLFNAQTNRSLIIPGYFLGSPPLQAQSSKEKKREMSWRENFICSVNLGKGSFLSNKTVDELFCCVLSGRISTEAW